eukprot:403337242
MRINTDLIQKCAQYLNALNEFHIDLRGYKIPFIENLAATNDQFSSIDLTDNEISRLENLPQLLRLSTLLLSNNRIAKVDPIFAEMCPKLESLILTNNKISNLQEIDNIAQGCKNCTLLRLSLVGNIVTNLPNYRAYVIHKIPSLRILDFQKVTQNERKEAKKLFEGQQAMKEMLVRQQEIDENLRRDTKQGTLGKRIISEEQLAINLKIQELEHQIDQAHSLDEIQNLERQIKELSDQNQGTEDN